MKQIPRIENIEERKMIGMFIETSLVENKTYQLWNQFMTRRKEILEVKNEDLYSIQVYQPDLNFNDFNEHTRFNKWAAVEVKNFDATPAGMHSLIIEQGKFAVFMHKGLLSQFQKTMSYIYGEWLPNSEYELDNRPQFEVMGKKYLGVDNPDSEEEVWIPIKRKENEY